MFIQTEATGDPATLRFIPGREVLASGAREFRDPAAARQSPLAAALFGLEEVKGVKLGPDTIEVTKANGADWQVVKSSILRVIMEHFVTGQPVLSADAATSGAEDFAAADAEIVEQIKDLIDTRIVPAVASSRGKVAFRGYREGTVFLELGGAAFGMIGGIENMLRHYVPEVKAVRDHREAMPKPGLQTAEAKVIQKLLDERINPAVAGHGGYVSLVDIQGDRAFIQLKGGCQGCGMADVTLKQGIEVEIKQAVPAIAEVLDVTDHANGTNPYYTPKGAHG